MSGLLSVRVPLAVAAAREACAPGLGTHPWSLPEEESLPFIAQALDLGVNFFDTANIYSLGTSEEFLGRAIRELTRRADVVIATKVYEKLHDSPLSGGLSRSAIMRELDACTVFHSDHGVLFTSWSFTNRVKEAGLMPSLGTFGDGYDNAMMESSWSKVQTELLDRKKWKTRTEANEAFQYLDIFHNRQRRHSKLGYLTPVEYERLHELQQPA